MHVYRKLAPTIWTGDTGRRLRSMGTEATFVAIYLITSPHSNMIGLYYLPVVYIAHDTGLGSEGALKGLQSCIDAGFCSYDKAAEVVFVHEMAAWQVEESLAANDNRVKNIQKLYDASPVNAFLDAFLSRYAHAFHLTRKRVSGEGPSEAPSKALQSQEQKNEKKQQQKNEKTIVAPRGDALPLLTSPGTTPANEIEPPTLLLLPKDDHTAQRIECEFNEVWDAYPQRPGRSRVDSLKAYRARRKEGHTHEEILTGVKAYAAFVAAEQTEPRFIKQLVTFFGPAKHFASDWPVSQAKPGKPGKPSRHSGFDTKDYRKGVNDDGSF